MTGPTVIKPEDEDYARCEKSLAYYASSSWKYLDRMPFVRNWHIDAIADHIQACLMGEIRTLVISAPPRFGKSFIASVAGPTWMWGPAGKPETKFLTVSSRNKIAAEYCLASRKLMSKTWYQEKWNVSVTNGSSSPSYLENKNTGYRSALSAKSVAPGVGYDVAIVDAPHSLEESLSFSVKGVKELIKWWDILSTKANNPNTARRILVSHRIDKHDLVGYVLSSCPDAVHLKLPMEYVPTMWKSPVDSWIDPRTVAGDLLDSVRFNATKVEELKRALSPSKYSAQCQQKPLA